MATKHQPRVVVGGLNVGLDCLSLASPLFRQLPSEKETTQMLLKPSVLKMAHVKAIFWPLTVFYVLNSLDSELSTHRT